MRTQTYGYDRRSKVPVLDGSKAKVCISCRAWFAAFGKERRCDACVPNSERHRRAQQRHYAGVTDPARQRKPERVLGLSLCRELALELAERIDYPKGRPQQMSQEFKRRITARNVALGLQGRADLARWQ